MKRLTTSFFVVAFLVTAVRVNAGTKEEMMRLQSDVLAMQNQIRMLEKTVNEQTEGLKSLVVQLNDQVGKSNLLLGKISASLEGQASSGKSGEQILSQEIRNLSTKLDDMATRISALAQKVADLKVQSQPLTPGSFPGAGGDSSPLSPDAIYNEAYNDLVQGNFDLAIEGFNAFVKNFPTSAKADDALYNVGEAYYNLKRMPQAVASFTRVINDYPDGDKVASSLFKRGKAELAMQERDNAIEDFKAVVQKYKDAPEAGLARAELEALGVNPSKTAKPAPARRKP
jgi:tol-pal system protein YbgF